MSLAPEPPRQRMLTRHITYRIPVIRRMAREVVEGDVDNAYAAIIAVVSLVAIAVLTFGFPALVISALIAAAVMFLFLLRITLG